MTRNYPAKYFAQREAALNGELPLPSISRSLDLAAQSRLNRLVLSYQIIFLWWDSEEKQQELADAFIPLRLELHTADKRPYGNRFSPKDMKRLRFHLDDWQVPFYPDMSKEERKAQEWFHLSCLLAHHSGGTQEFRPLGGREASQLRKLQDLPKKASALTINTGLKKYPVELKQRFTHIKEPPA